MELDELRQRLLLRSKASEMPAMTNPASIPEIALGHSNNTPVKWEPIPAEKATRSPSIAIAADGPKLVTADQKDPTRAAVAAPAEAISAATNDAQQFIEKEPAMSIANNNGKSLAGNGYASEPASILSNAADDLMEPAESFREHFAQLSSLLHPIDTATESTEQALRRIVRLYDHLSGLAATFQSVKAFAEQVKTLSTTFQPMKPLNDQMNHLIETFYLNVKELGTALEPVKAFQVKVRQLATSLDSINDLEGRLNQLAEAFRPTPERFVSQQELRG
jgi:uncharacterized phage infection (PIP) family protein YhgE